MADELQDPESQPKPIFGSLTLPMPSDEEIEETRTLALLISGNDSHSSTAILGMAHLEEKMGRLAEAILVPGRNRNERRELFGNSGFFRFLKNSSQLLYVFGYLQKVMCDDLDLIRKIRNEFGHSAKATLTFDSPKVASFVSNLQYVRAIPLRAGITIKGFTELGIDPKSNLFSFVETVILVGMGIDGLIRESKKIAPEANVPPREASLTNPNV